MIVLAFSVALSAQASTGVLPILNIAHVTRHRGETRETRIYLMRSHDYFVEQVDQKQSSPTPDCRQSRAVLSDQRFQSITSITDSSEFHRLRNPSSTIDHQDGDYWYISTKRETGTQFLAFRTEDKKTPGVVKQVIVWFEEVEKLKGLEAIHQRDEDRCSVFSDETESIWRR